MEDTTLKYNILIAKLMGYEEASLEYKMRWLGVDTEERVNRIKPQYIPIMVNGSDDEPLFVDTFYYPTDWSCLMPVVEEINKRDWVTIYNDSCKIHSLVVNEFETIEVINEGEPLIKSVFEAVGRYSEWYVNNRTNN